jgi:hypothetical protein
VGWWVVCYSGRTAKENAQMGGIEEGLGSMAYDSCYELALQHNGAIGAMNLSLSCCPVSHFYANTMQMQSLVPGQPMTEEIFLDGVTNLEAEHRACGLFSERSKNISIF